MFKSLQTCHVENIEMCKKEGGGVGVIVLTFEIHCKVNYSCCIEDHEFLKAYKILKRS